MDSRSHGVACARTFLAAACVWALRAALFPGIAAAQLPDNVEIHGFVMGNFAGRTLAAPEEAPQGDFLLAEERLRLDLETWADSVDASAQVRADFVHDAVDNTFDIDLREAYLDYITGDFDFRIGRQVATWGVGDLVFINDVFPKDWVSFFSGRPLEYLKTGVDGFRTRYSSGVLNAELLVLPVFTPDTLPTGERFLLPDPFEGIPKDARLPPSSYDNTELAFRLYGRTGGFDVSGYLYRGFWRTPGFELDDPLAPTRVTGVHPHLSVYGASAQRNFLGGVLSLEAGYYDFRETETREIVGVPDLEKRFLVGYQKEIRTDFTLGVQYYAEDSPESPSGAGGYRDTVTLRLDRYLEQQIWKLGLFAFYSPADNDYLLQPQIAYKFSDEFGVTAGANLFGGAETTFLGRFDGNDNVYASFRFDF